MQVSNFSEGFRRIKEVPDPNSGANDIFVPPSMPDNAIWASPFFDWEDTNDGALAMDKKPLLIPDEPFVEI